MQLSVRPFHVLNTFGYWRHKLNKLNKTQAGPLKNSQIRWIIYFALHYKIVFILGIFKCTLKKYILYSLVDPERTIYSWITWKLLSKIFQLMSRKHCTLPAHSDSGIHPCTLTSSMSCKLIKNQLYLFSNIHFLVIFNIVIMQLKFYKY